MKRRKLLEMMGGALAGSTLSSSLFAEEAKPKAAPSEAKKPTFEEFVRDSAVKKGDLDRFLSPDEPTWAKFDPDLGYVLGNYMPRDGLDGSATISSIGRNKARHSAIYADRPCRLNTYGNSFTQCHQVSNQETWQEYLAAHLGEPIRNFGMGGYGVYQSYRRMVRTEQTKDAAEYVILYIWGDDHMRSALRCRHVLTQRWFSIAGGRMFHGNFWAHVEIDLDSGKLVEKENPLSTPDSLYKMTDPDFMVEAMRGDLMLEMSAFCGGTIADVSVPKVNRLAEILGCPPVGANDRDKPRKVEAIQLAYGFAATKYIVEAALKFAGKHGKKLLVVLFCPHVTRQLLTGAPRYDQPIVDYLDQKRIKYFDMNLVHAKDYRSFKISVDEYLGRYLIGHYSPAGNHFFAFAIKNTIVDWLDPKPITYRHDDQAMLDFRGYLPH